MDRFLDPTYIAPLLGCAFFAVLFLQSGLDKVFDWKGNMEWLGPHFAKTPFKGLVPLLLGTLTLMEVATGVICAMALFMALTLAEGVRTWVVVAMGLVGLTLLMLFFGQRMAKDYPGASTIAIYFGVVMLILFMLGPSPMIPSVIG